MSGQNVEWICDNGHMWGFTKRSENIIAVGTEKQQFGFFPKVQNPQADAWHGYPVIPFKEKNKKYDISNSLLEFWVNNNVLNEDEIATIIKVFIGISVVTKAPPNPPLPCFRPINIEIL